jgi:CTP synthase
MRLGSYDATLQAGTIVESLYTRADISERHRHRYEVNIAYHEDLQKGDLVFSGLSPNKKLVEFIELKNHPFFVGTQGHPEFKSRIDNPHPLFV